MEASPLCPGSPRLSAALAMRPLALLGAAALMLGGCATDPTDDVTTTPADTAEVEAPAPDADGDDAPATADDEPTDAQDEGEDAEEDPDTTTSTQAESCDWDSPVLSAGASAPSGQDGDLTAIIVGAWQHTHIDSGSGFEPIEDKDIRYVFPSPERMLYCQHVPGVTEYAENGGDISWEDTGIVLPNGQVGYTVTAWDENSIVWKNEYEGSSYLLQRR